MAADARGSGVAVTDRVPPCARQAPRIGRAVVGDPRLRVSVVGPVSLRIEVVVREVVGRLVSGPSWRPLRLAALVLVAVVSVVGRWLGVGRGGG